MRGELIMADMVLPRLTLKGQLAAEHGNWIYRFD
jgi:hypothetical protein